MKTHSRIHPSARLCFAACAAWLALPAVFAQQDADTQSEAYQASMTQSDVRREAAAIQAQMIELRNQMRQLMPDDVASVDQAIKKLGTLSAGEMADAMKSLEDASRSKDANGQAGKISAAMKSQGAASNELNKLAVDLRMRETLLGMDSALTGLVRRQVAVNSETVRLGAIQQMPDKLHNNDATRCQLAIENQKSLGADLKLLGKRIDTLAQDITDDSKNGLVLAAQVAKAQNLSGLADNAQGLIGSGPFNDAGAAQMEVIHALVAMEQALAGSQDPLDRLRKFVDRLQQSMVDQQMIVDAVMLIGERQDLERSFKQMQANVNDEVATIRYEVQPVNNPVADLLAPAGDAGSKSIANFRRMWEEHMDARVNTQDSLKYITAGYEALKQQIAKAEAAQPQTAAELAAMLDSLQREVAAAAVQQAQAAKQPMPPPVLQQAKADRVNDFQQRALPISPEAATALGEAANNLATTTPEAQTAAAQKLAEAAQELLKQKEKAEAIATAQEQIEKAQQQTADAQEKLDNANTPAAAEDLKNAQQNADAAGKKAQAAAPEATQDAQKAGNDLGAAKQDAGQKQGEAAKAKAGDAAAALAEAAQGLAQAAGQLPGMGKGVSQTAQKGPPGPKGKGNGGGGDSGDNLAGAGDTGGPVEVLHGLNPKDRGAVMQFQNEAPPREFVPDVQQYYKNIADGGGL
ncbi:MAG: hypothetical protein V4819_07435 [Verrucomicrobiota bacterium]